MIGVAVNKREAESESLEIGALLEGDVADAMGKPLEVLAFEVAKDLHEGLGYSRLGYHPLLLSAVSLVRSCDLDRGESLGLKLQASVSLLDELKLP